MKKVLFMAFAVAGLCLTSCKDKAPAAAEEATTEEVAVVDEAATDPSVELAAALEAKDQSKFESLLNTVKEKAADPKFKEYVEKAQNFLKEKAEDIKSFVGDNKVVSGLIDNVSSIDLTKLVPEVATEAAENAVEGAVEGAKNAAEGAVEGAKSAVEGAKEAGEKVVDDAKAAADKAAETVKDAGAAAKQAATDAANKAIDKGADAAKKALGL